MNTDATKLRLPIAVVGTLIVLLVPVIAAYATTNDRVQTHEVRIDHIEKNTEHERREHEQHHVEIELLKQALQTLTGMAQETRDDVKELKRRGR